MKLTYPRELVDLGFIIPKGLEGDQVLENLKVRLKEVQGRNGAGGKFNHVTILRQDVEVPIVSQDEKGMLVTQTESNLQIAMRWNIKKLGDRLCPLQEILLY